MHENLNTEFPSPFRERGLAEDKRLKSLSILSRAVETAR